MSAPYWIVLAWVSMDGVELTGRYLDRLQQVRETRLAPKAKACTWLHGPEVNAKEITRAKAFADCAGQVRQQKGHPWHRADR